MALSPPLIDYGAIAPTWRVSFTPALLLHDVFSMLDAAAAFVFDARESYAAMIAQLRARRAARATMPCRYARCVAAVAQLCFRHTLA